MTSSASVFLTKISYISLSLSLNSPTPHDPSSQKPMANLDSKSCYPSFLHTRIWIHSNRFVRCPKPVMHECLNISFSGSHKMEKSITKSNHLNLSFFLHCTLSLFFFWSILSFSFTLLYSLCFCFSSFFSSLFILFLFSFTLIVLSLFFFLFLPIFN